LVDDNLLWISRGVVAEKRAKFINEGTCQLKTTNLLPVPGPSKNLPANASILADYPSDHAIKQEKDNAMQHEASGGILKECRRDYCMHATKQRENGRWSFRDRQAVRQLCRAYTGIGGPWNKMPYR